VLVAGRVLTLISMPPDSAAGSQAPAQNPCGPVLALDWPEAVLGELVPDGGPDHENLLTNLLAGCAQARARGYVHHLGNDTEPASYAAPVRDFRGVVLAALQLVPRPHEASAATNRHPGEALVATVAALSADLGYEGGALPRHLLPQSRPRR
jgi:DNA-binding IclR family transcriptional regulator